MAQNLTFNVLTFSHPSEEYEFHFSSEEIEDSYRVHHSLVPSEVINHFGQQEHYYTQYSSNGNGLYAVIKKSKSTYIQSDECEDKYVKVPNTAFSSSLIKRYYILQIHNYFKSIGVMVKPNFIDDLEVWLPVQINNAAYNFFEKYLIKVQFALVTNKPELQITYEGQSKVFKKSILDMMAQVASDCFNWVIYENNLYRFEELSEEAKRNYNKVFPVLNFDIRDALRLPTESPDRSNPYIKYKTHITFFFNTYLNTEGFKKVIPIDCNAFIPVKELNIGTVTENTNILLFGDNKQHIVPYKGMDANGPLETPKVNRIQFFYIFHINHKSQVELLNGFLEKGMHSYKGMYNFAKVPFNTEAGFSIAFKDLNNPIPEIEEAIRKRNFKPDVQYIAIYVSPHSKNSSNKQHKSIYYKLKELLLKRSITSQTIEAQKIKDDKYYAYSLNNISIAVLAKLNGVPWRLNVKPKNELIVGVGAFKNVDTDVQYIGSAFSFTNSGRFNSFDCFMKNQVDELAGSIIQAVKDYVAVQNPLTRLVIHFYKQMNSRELEVIEKSLYKLGLKIPVFIVTINKTESQDIVAFDNSWSDLMPESGTFINIGHGRYLLFNNTRYPKATFSPSDGFPFPIKLYINCSNPELEKDYKTIKELLDQVYQFSRMYWKSVRQQNLPVTIKYPEMVAEMFPHFEGNEIPDFGKDNLWFL